MNQPPHWAQPQQPTPPHNAYEANPVPPGWTPPPDKSRKWKIIGGVVAGFFALGIFGSFLTDEDTEPDPAPPTAAPVKAADVEQPADTAKQKPAGEKASAEPSPSKAPDGTPPNLVGQDLQYAQDSAQAAGFYLLLEDDASGLGRIPVLDRGWQVCAQAPAAGTHPTDTEVTFSVVRDEETC